MPTGEHRLWWAVLHRAAWDVAFGTRSDALDALEFLKSTGLWLLTEMFSMDIQTAQKQIVKLLLSREEPLEIS